MSDGRSPARGATPQHTCDGLSYGTCVPRVAIEARAAIPARAPIAWIAPNRAFRLTKEVRCLVQSHSGCVRRKR